MWFIIILIIIVVVCVVVKNASNTTNNDTYINDNSYEAKERFEAITESEKQQLSQRGGNNLLSFTLNQYQQAVNGDTGAMVALGAIYQSKLDNAYKAAFWYEKAHQSGDWEGTYWYGECCISGYGVEKNGTLGYGYLLMAAQHGNESAIDAFRQRGMSVEEMRSHGIPV